MEVWPACSRCSCTRMDYACSCLLIKEGRFGDKADFGQPTLGDGETTIKLKIRAFKGGRPWG